MTLTKPNQDILDMAPGFRAGPTVSISSGSAAAVEPALSLLAEGGAPSDELDTLSTDGMADGGLLMLHAADPAQTIIVKHGTGNIRTANGADLILDTPDKTVLLRRAGIVWQVVSPRPANRVLVKDTTQIGPLTALIPGDNTIPQNTEGTEVISASITPRSASSILRVTCEIPVLFAQTFCASVLAIYRDDIIGALAVGVRFIPTGGNFAQMSLTHEEQASSTDLSVFKVRVGPANAANIFINGNNSSQIFGGVSTLTLLVEELEN